jgi:hypothetical protein
MEKKKWNYCLKLSIIGLLLMLFAIVIVGGGHGLLEPFFILFPYSFLIGNFVSEEVWIIMILILLQFPAYGYFLDKNPVHLKRTAIIMLIIHIICAIIASQNLNAGFK